MLNADCPILSPFLGPKVLYERVVTHSLTNSFTHSLFFVYLNKYFSLSLTQSGIHGYSLVYIWLIPHGIAFHIQIYLNVKYVCLICQLPMDNLSLIYTKLLLGHTLSYKNLFFSARCAR